MKSARTLIIASLLASALSLSACSSTPVVAGSSREMGTITVNSSAKQSVTPDVATIYLETITQATSAESAQSENAQATNKLIARLKELGIDEKEIQVAYTNLNPVYNAQALGNDIVAYEMYTRIRVDNIEIDRVGVLIQEAVAAGASSVNGPEYYASSYDEAYELALADAIAQAQKKAQVMANAAGVKLQGIVSLEEGYQNTIYRVETAAAADGLSAEEALDIEPGTIDIEASVTVHYGID